MFRRIFFNIYIYIVDEFLKRPFLRETYPLSKYANDYGLIMAKLLLYYYSRMNECVARLVLPLFHTTVVLKALATMKTLVFKKIFCRSTQSHSLCWRESRRGTPEVLSSLYPSFSTSWDLGVAPAASALASRN